MKISKHGIVAAVLVAVLFILAISWMNRRAVAQAETRVAAQLAEKMAAEARKEFDDERIEFKKQQDAWIEQALVAGEAYSNKSQEAEAQRRKAEDAARANKSLDAAWSVKYGKLEKIHIGTLTEWKTSDEAMGAAHNEEVGKLKGALTLANNSIADLERDIRGTFAEDGKTLLEPGYIQKLAAAEALAAVLKKRGKDWFVHGPGAFVFYRNGKIDAAPGYGMIVRIGGY